MFKPVNTVSEGDNLQGGRLRLKRFLTGILFDKGFFSPAPVASHHRLLVMLPQLNSGGSVYEGRV